MDRYCLSVIAIVLFAGVCTADPKADDDSTSLKAKAKRPRAFFAPESKRPRYFTQPEDSYGYYDLAKRPGGRSFDGGNSYDWLYQNKRGGARPFQQKAKRPGARAFMGNNGYFDMAPTGYLGSSRSGYRYGRSSDDSWRYKRPGGRPFYGYADNSAPDWMTSYY